MDCDSCAKKIVFCLGPSRNAVENKTKKKKQTRLVWKHIEVDKVAIKNIEFTGDLPEHLELQREPIDYFRQLITNEMLCHVVNETIKYSVQIDPSNPMKFSKEELEQFIGILFITSIIRMPSVRDYWDLATRYEKIANVMPVRRFEQIKRFLHFNDNEAIPKECPDRLYKIRPLIDLLKEKFRQFTPSEYICIDEQMVPFKGRSTLKQYNPHEAKEMGL